MEPNVYTFTLLSADPRGSLADARILTVSQAEERAIAQRIQYALMVCEFLPLDDLRYAAQHSRDVTDAIYLGIDFPLSYQ